MMTCRQKFETHTMQAVQDTTTPTSIKIQLIYTALVSLFYIILPNYLIHIYSKQDWVPMMHILCKQEQMYTHVPDMARWAIYYSMPPIP